MPMWEIPVEISSTGRLIMQGPTAEAIKEVLSKTSDKKIKGHIRNVISFVKVQRDSIRRINEKDDIFAASGSVDRMSRNQQAVVDCEGRGHNVDEDHSPGEEPVVVEADDCGPDESPEPVGEAQPAEESSQVAQPVGIDGSDCAGSDEVQADEVDPLQDHSDQAEYPGPYCPGEQVQGVLQEDVQEAEAGEEPSPGQAVPAETEEEVEEAEAQEH